MIFSRFRQRPSGEDQLRNFVDLLVQQRPEDMGLAVATIEHTANTQFIYGDFYKPQELMAKRPDVLGIGVLEVQRLQGLGLEVMAVGWIVWVHTFRAVQHPELMPLARSMWALLIRGAPYAFDQSETLVPVVGFELRIDDPNRVPEGFA